jgi:hypothetical protein
VTCGLIMQQRSNNRYLRAPRLVIGEPVPGAPRPPLRPLHRNGGGLFVSTDRAAVVKYVLLCCLMLRSSRQCSRRRVSSEPKNYAELSFWVSWGWMVASGPSGVFCPPLWRRSRPASPG